MGDSTRMLHEIVEAFEERLSGSPFNLVTLDRIDIPKALPSTLLHLGFGVDIPSGANTGQYRDLEMARWNERVRVTLSYRVNPQQQRASRNAAYTLEDQVRAYLCCSTWEGDLHVRCLDATRAPSPVSSEWFLITLTFSATRDARLGG